MILVTHQIMLFERHTPFPLLNDHQLCLISKSREPPKPSNLVGGTILTNHHVYDIGTFCTKCFLLIPPPTTLVSMSAGFSSVLTCHFYYLSNSMITNTVGFLLKLRFKALSKLVSIHVRGSLFGYSHHAELVS